MMNLDKVDHLRFCIGRFDHYFESVNNKSAVFLAVSTFIVGGLMAAYPSIQTGFECGFWINTLFTGVVIVGIISIVLTLIAGIPFFKSSTDKSVIYFGSVSAMDVDEFRIKLESMTQDELDKDYVAQVHQLSKGLFLKFRFLKWSGYLILMEFILAIPLIILLVNNIKKK